jgi:hypothetical protein
VRLGRGRGPLSNVRHLTIKCSKISIDKLIIERTQFPVKGGEELRLMVGRFVKINQDREKKEEQK